MFSESAVTPAFGGGSNALDVVVHAGDGDISAEAKGGTTPKGC